MKQKIFMSILSTGLGVLTVPAAGEEYLVRLKSSLRTMETRLSPQQVSQEELVELLSAGEVEAFEPNYTYHLMFGSRKPGNPPAPPKPAPKPVPKPSPIPAPAPSPGAGAPNDQLFKDQWALLKTNAVAAWRSETGSRQIRVAVMDTGVDLLHKDLLCNLETGFNATKPGDAPQDQQGHGTHVAGIVGACSNNGIGIAGVAQVNIVPIKASRDGSFSNSDIIRGIDWAIEQKVDVINMSFGGPANSTFLYEALKEASDAGILLVAAAGNSAENNDVSPSYPANYALANLISVASSTDADSISSFSNYGPSLVHVAAPGSNVLSTLVGGGYGYKSGTSMAAPFVAGALGLLLSHRPQITAAEAKRLVTSKVSTTSGRATRSNGRVDLKKLLE